MKKSKLSIGLVSGFIAAMALSACNSGVTASDKSVVTFKPHNGGEEVSIITDSMYDKFKTTTSGISKFYEQILEVLIRYDFQASNGHDGSAAEEKSLASIEKEAEAEVEQKKTEATNAAKNNNTSYETEWEAILDQKGVKDAEELKQLIIYEKEKVVMQDWYYKKNEATLTKEFIGIDASGNAVAAQTGYGELSSKLPYHIRHILVNNSDGATDFTRGTIDKTQTEKLHNVIDKLLNSSETFGQIAVEDSEDTGSGANYGDVGIVENTASDDGSLKMVPEFQLGIYAYDALLSRKNNVAINKGLGLADTDLFHGSKISEFIKSDKFAAGNTGIAGLTEVPVNVFEDMYEYRDVTTAADGHKVLNTDAEAVVYPRNILWNKYLNHHNPFIITNRNRTKIGDISSVTLGETNTLKAGYDTTVEEKALGKCGFKSAYDLGLIETDNGMKVLTDEHDNVIIGVRSQFGIHFTIIEKSIFDFNEDVTLEEYYTTKIPSEDGYPVDASGKDKLTYVNFIKSEDSTPKQRASDVKDKIKNYDSTYNYRLYEELVAKYKDNLTFAKTSDGKTIDTFISSYITLQREKAADIQAQGMNKAWKKYLETIELQNKERDNEAKIVPEGCVIGFKKVGATGAAEYEKGGKCYYGK